MDIGEAIKQKNFTSEYQKIAINLTYTHFWFKNYYSEFIKPFGITIQQFNVMRILKGQHPNGITTSEIRSRMLDKNCDASRLVDRLEKNKMVTKCTNQIDKRLVEVTITQKGIAQLNKINMKEEEMQEIVKTLSIEEAKTLNLLLDKLRG